MGYPKILLLLCAGALLDGCAGYHHQKQTAALTFPELGQVIHYKKGILFNKPDPTGTLQWNDAISLRAQVMPFNKKSYAVYSNAIKQAGKVNSIAYVDSLPLKPKYLKLQMDNKVALTALLNHTTNQDLNDYVQNDPDYKLVTWINVSLTEADIAAFSQAQGISLQKDKQGKSVVVLKNQTGNDRSFTMDTLPVFAYGYVSFCWEEDQYNRLKIATLLPEGENCPRGTHKKAAKAKEERSYLKLRP